jgi:hypothetical protein
LEIVNTEWQTERSRGLGQGNECGEKPPAMNQLAIWPDESECNTENRTALQSVTRKAARPRAHVIAAYQSSHEPYSELYKKLAK